MLLYRVLTAIPLAIAVIWVILYQPSELFIYLLLLISLLASYEWAQLGGLQNKIVRTVFALFVTVIPWLVIQYLFVYAQWYIYLSVAWWLGVSVYLKDAEPVNKGIIVAPAKLATAFLVIPSAVVAMYMIHHSSNGPQWLLFGLALIWIADIGAYFSGRKFGRHKLAPKISPGKTNEGLIGAVIATTAYALVVAYFSGLPVKQYLMLVFMAIILTLISVVGDLYESVLKRESGIKDSGNILPGHGGMLDRVDSVLAAMPVFLVAHNWLIMPVDGF